MGQMTEPTMRGHRLFAATYDWLNRSAERRVLGPMRSALVGQATGRVLEIGAGTGANFLSYDPSHVTTVVAIEPDPYMLVRARRRASAARVSIDLRQVSAENLPFPDASFDTIVATLVLCTVADPDRALQEMRRVLVPGGSLRFVEHVRAPGGFAAHLQDLLTPLWRRVGAGCHLNRRTVEAIEAAGFEIVELESRQLRGTPIHTLVAGVARRPAERDEATPGGKATA